MIIVMINDVERASSRPSPAVISRGSGPFRDGGCSTVDSPEHLVDLRADSTARVQPEVSVGYVAARKLTRRLKSEVVEVR